MTKQTINGKIITYQYSHGLMTQKNADGIVTNISYNKANLPKTYTTQKNNSMLSSYSYTYSLDGNRIGEVDNVNNITRAYTYDGVGRLTNESISGSVDLNMSYTYDIRGNRTKKTVTGDESYTVTSFYNNSNRLTSSTKRVNGVISEMDQYGYDSNGNQISKMHTDYGTASLSDVGEAMRNDYEYFEAAPEEEEAPEMIMDEAEEAELEEDEPEGIYFGGDEAAESIGDIIPEAETKADEPDITEYIPDDTAELMDTAATTETFTYNARNQLISYTKGSTSASYTYGANGLRKSKTVGSTTDFVWNGNNLAAEKKSGSIKNIYSYGTDGIAISNINGTLSYYLKDAHGNVVGTTSASGNITQPYSYDAFGNHLSTPSLTDNNPFRYCGEYYDTESGNIYLRARYYDTATGRFISEDPAKDGLNWYSYCAGNPVMAVDPSGLDAYIIYDINGKSGDKKHSFADEAEIKRQELVHTWGTPIHVIGVSDVEEFKNAWNYKVGYDIYGNDVPIEEVYIIAHGGITGEKENDTAQSFFMFAKDNSTVFAKNNENSLNITVNDLAWKKIEHLTFSTCNSGNPDVYNLAYAFKLRMTITYIHAWDGGTVFDYKQKRLLRGGYDSGDWKKDIKGQGTWYKYVNKYESGEPVRRRIGYRLIYG